MSNFETARTAMVDCQIRPSDVTKYPIISAMLALPRERFVPNSKRDIAYVDDIIDLGEGRFLPDARGFAKMLDEVNIQPDELVLDIGAGLGFSSAVIARLAEAVIGVEVEPSFVEQGNATLSELGVNNAFLVHAPLADGVKKYGPYDVIFVEGGIETLPDAISKQLKDQGRIVAVQMSGMSGRCAVGIKHNGSISWRGAFDLVLPVLPGFSKPVEFSFA